MTSFDGHRLDELTGVVAPERTRGTSFENLADESLTPIDHYLQQQQQLTAVERFSQRHDADAIPAQARYYHDLIPLERPAPGQQYAFDVDLDSCTGCKACVTACHSLNGLDDDESFRSVGLLTGAIEPWQQTVTTACHHCVDPACLSGCPVNAYEKVPVTGIVKHLDDQCIGCSYCTLTCPYEVPRYNARLGIVRKCDLCSDRLAVGEAPACVQACPTYAISVAVIEVAAAVNAAAEPGHTLVPTAPPSDLTIPTTRYRSARPVPQNTVPGDQFSLRPSHAHTPLAVMLVLTQASVGAFAADLALRSVSDDSLATAVRPYAAGGALSIGLIALAASILHLGRPQYAWRAVIGLRHSWLSREILIFSIFALAAAIYGFAVWRNAPGQVVTALGATVVLSGVAGVLCSAMIYAVTGRRWWRLRVTAPKFLLSAVITGPTLALTLAVVALLISGVGSGDLHAAVPFLVAVMIATAIKLGLEGLVLLHLRDDTITDLRRTALLLTDDLRLLSNRRVAGAIVGGFVLPLVLVLHWVQPAPSNPSLGWSLAVLVAMLVANVAGELAERRTFFSAVSAPRMPGGLQ
jgi:formate dehydrogenase iron-sulfur subunit